MRCVAWMVLFLFIFATEAFAPPTPKHFLVKKKNPPCLPPLVELAKNLEYDHEILGLYVPKGWTPEMVGSLYVGRARIVPAPAKLYSLGWKPAFVLENVRFGGSINQLGQIAAKASVQSKTPIFIRGALTSDASQKPAYLMAEKGNWRWIPE